MFFLLLPKDPTGYPTVVQIIRQTSSLVTFQWKELECYEENGPIIGYHYRLYHNLFHYSEGIVQGNITTLTLTYENMEAFSVAAINEAGFGAYCPPVAVPDFVLGDVDF